MSTPSASAADNSLSTVGDSLSAESSSLSAELRMIRKDWTKGSKVEVYSKSAKQWKEGEIVRIFTDGEGEWLVIHYKSNNATRSREVSRYDTTAIRTICRSDDIVTSDPVTFGGIDIQFHPKITRIYRDELFVYGYVRLYFRDINGRIPDVIKQLCLLFYGLNDQWDATNQGSPVKKAKIEIDKISRIATVIREGGSDWINAFGSLIIRSGEKQTWRVRIWNNQEFHIYAMIGIIDIQLVQKEELLWFFCQDQIGGIGYYNLDGNIFRGRGRESYGEKWNHADIITMTLDMTQNKGILSYCTNDKEQGIAVDNIDINKEYCLAVATTQNKDHIQILTETDIKH